MARILALDYGEKRTGIAVTDELQCIASALTTVPTKGLLLFLKDYMAKEKVEKILVGEPKRHSGESPALEGAIQEFIKRFQKEEVSVPVERIDERFTSKMAFRTLLDAGLKKKQRRDKGLIDKISATLILQSYLDGKKRA
jgi:putative Holliday junction resolvase